MKKMKQKVEIKRHNNRYYSLACGGHYEKERNINIPIRNV